MAKLLITGGAGYVGAVCARAARNAGHEVVVFDSLAGGYREAVSGELVVGDLRDRAALDAVLSRGFDAVLHFAARMSVGESNEDPVGYFDVNVGGTLTLLESMRAHGCKVLVFSSTCAIYGRPERVPLDEDLPHAPISPYGETKAVVERILALARPANGMKVTCLRYFNAAGAASDGSLGESHFPETHLIPLALEAAATGRPMTVFGTQHPTPDGTCVRDYVHVEDLADAHLRALDLMLAGHPGGAWNLGTAHGASVFEVMDTIERVTGHHVARTLGPARDGDPPMLVANAARAYADLGWRATRDLETVIRDAWAWYQKPLYGRR